MKSAIPPPVPNSKLSEFRFSLRDFPERERMAAWQDILGRHIVKAEVTPVVDETLHCEVTARSLSGLSMLTAGISSGFVATRTRELISQGGDDIILTVVKEGTFTLTQFNREAVAGAGEACAVASASVGHVGMPSGSEFVVLSVPRTALAPFVHDLETSLVRPLHAGPVGLLRHYLAALQDVSMAESQELQRTFVTHVNDLIALTLGATRDAAEIANGRGARAARLRAIKDDILANLQRPDLSPDFMAQRHRISTRYIRVLFAGEATSFSDFVRDQRLARAYRALNNPRQAARSISSIAYDAGFSDLSHFNHAFRRAYDATPSDIRAAADGRDDECQGE